MVSSISSAASAPRRLVAIILLLLVSSVTCDPNAPCYDSTGVWTPGFYPCDPFAITTSCCQQGWTCFSSGLCIVTTPTNSFPNLTMGAVMRGYCTNPLWNDNFCGNRCLDKDNAKGEMVACGSDKFCCLADYFKGTCSCTGSPGNAFTLLPGKAQTIIDVRSTSFTGTPTYYTVPPTRTSSSITTTSSKSSSTTPKPSSSETGTTGTSTGASPTTTGNGTDTGSTTGGPALGAGPIAGIAVGAVAVVGAAIFAIYKLVKRHRQSKEKFLPGIGDDDGDAPPVGAPTGAPTGGPYAGGMPTYTPATYGQTPVG